MVSSKQAGNTLETCGRARIDAPVQPRALSYNAKALPRLRSDAIIVARRAWSGVTARPKSTPRSSGLLTLREHASAIAAEVRLLREVIERVEMLDEVPRETH